MSSRTLPFLRGLLVMGVAGFALSGIVGMFGASDPLTPLGMPPAFLKRSIVAVIDTGHSKPSHATVPAPHSSSPTSGSRSASTQGIAPTDRAGGSNTQSASPADRSPRERSSGSGTSPRSSGSRSQGNQGGTNVSSDAVAAFRPVAGASCGGCRVTQNEDGSIGATIPGEGRVTDSAYALLDFGGSRGVAGPVFVRESLSLGAGQVPTGDLHVAQVSDVANRVVYRLVISGGSRSLRFASPPGGLSADPIDVDTGAVVPNDGSSSVRVSVSFDPVGLLVVKVNGSDVVRKSGLEGASTGPPRYLAAGIVASDPGGAGSGNRPITVTHSGVSAGPAGAGGGAPGPSPTPKLSPGPPATVAVPAAVAPPSHPSQAAVGSPLSADLGVWNDPTAQLDAQWQRCDAAGQQCAAIADATAKSYTPTKADVGLTLRVRVAATNSAGTGTAYSTSTDPVLTAGVPVLVSPPTISGTAVAGSALTGASGTWDDATSFAYAWERCDVSGKTCTAISGADQATFQLSAADVGSTIRFIVTASGRTAKTPAESDPTGVVAVAAPTVVTLPSISGDAVEGGPLAASPGAWSDPNAQLTYAWLRCNANGECTPIDGGTGSSLTLTSADVGFTIEVVVTATNATGKASATSAPTAKVAAAAPPPPPPPPPPDTGGTPPDNGATPPPDDGGTPPPDDGGTPPPDNQGTPPADNEGTSPDDEGTPQGDEGTPTDNSGGSQDGPGASGDDRHLEDGGSGGSQGQPHHGCPGGD